VEHGHENAVYDGLELLFRRFNIRHLCSLRCLNCCHSVDNGRSVCISAHSETSLVSSSVTYLISHLCVLNSF